jgi:bifunctional DNA-binding transcriptional regulator/antitoxin component of YhaV-PrlF toxin-antitoxin module
MRYTKLVRPLRSGQITIPASFRQALKFDEQTLLQITLEDGELRLRPVELANVETGADWLRDLYYLFAPVRWKAAAYTEEEINNHIDAVLQFIRDHPHASSRS